MKALDLLHQAMLVVFLRRTAMAIEMARDGGTFVRSRRLFCLTKNIAKRPWYGPFKLMPSCLINLIGVISL